MDDDDNIKIKLSKLRDVPGQTPGIVAACNAVLMGVASRATRDRVLRLAGVK